MLSETYLKNSFDNDLLKLTARIIYSYRRTKKASANTASARPDDAEANA